MVVLELCLVAHLAKISNTMLNIHDLHVSFGGEPIFEEITLISNAEIG
jgi:hypothetical protein